MKKIILKISQETETKFFSRFLHSKLFPQHKYMIFSSFPELKEKIDSSKKKEKIIIREFLTKIREDNKDNIEKSIIFIKNEIEKKGEKSLQILANLMDYKWKLKSEDYILMPTLLPFCPFEDNTFLYSIYRSLKGKVEYPDVLAVSMHEISHFIFFDILKDKKIELNQDLLYFVKELVAPVLVYQDDFDELFKKGIIGNYNVLEIYFEQNNKIVKAFDYFLEMFIKNRQTKKDFSNFLSEMISISKKIEPEIKGKIAFYNKNGMNIMKDPELLKKFQEPIKI